ncbi:MAG: T9SS type A sorting domain-containing protein [Brumimicrobium sp.]
MDYVHAEEPMAITIAVHNSDPMAVSSYNSGTNSLPGFTGGYPYAAVDRVIGMDPGDIQVGVNQRKDMAVPCSVDFENIEVTATEIIVTARVNMVTDILTGSYGLSVVLTEDSVKGSGGAWKQVNGYYNFANLIDINGVNWMNLASPVDQSALLGGYNHVARALGANNMNGATGSLPATLNNGESYTHTYTFPRSSNWNVNNMHAIGMFVNKTTGEIINAGQIDLSSPSGLAEEANTFGLSVFPNPTNSVANIQLKLENPSEISLVVYNMIGEVVHSKPTEKVNAGTNVYTIDLSHVSNGVYLCHINVNGETKVTKLNVLR